MHETSPQGVRNLPHQRKIAFRTNSCSHMRKSQARYIAYYNNCVRKLPRYSSRSYVFVDNPPIRANQGAAESIASQTFNKLPLPTTTAFKILQEHDKTLAIDENGFSKTTPTDWETLALITLPRAQNLDTLQPCDKRLP